MKTLTVVDYCDCCLYLDNELYMYVSQHDLDELGEIYFNLLTKGIEKTVTLEMNGYNNDFFEFFELNGGFPPKIRYVDGVD